MSYLITEIDVTQPYLPVTLRPRDSGVALIVRCDGRPIAFLMQELSPQSVLPAAELERIVREGVPSERLNGAGRAREDRHAVGSTLPSITVAICTKDHPDDLRRCLERLVALRWGDAAARFEVLVVDNAPSDERTAHVVAEYAGVRYAREPKPGLDFARNCAIREATGDILAFIDDDVLVDRIWFRGLRKAIVEHPDAGAYTGLVLPAELETDAQILFERRGGFEKNFETTRFGQTLPGRPFYPCIGGGFGTGCNMAFVRNVVLDLGGFDEALDVGSPLTGGGDSDMLYRVVRAGHPIVYEPQFLVFHRHRREYRELRSQYRRSWGQGMMAYVVKTYKNDPVQRPNLRRLVKWWLGYELGNLLKSLTGRGVLPADMVLAELWGGIVGLTVAYPRAVKLADQIRKRAG